MRIIEIKLVVFVGNAGPCILNVIENITEFNSIVLKARSFIIFWQIVTDNVYLNSIMIA